MASLNTLPLETLHHIVSYLSSDISDLLNCSVSSRALSDVANAALYRDIDLSPKVLYFEDSKPKRQRLRLLQSLSDNSKLGGFVRTFNNYPDVIIASDTHIDMLVRAAPNMNRLCETSLSPNPLSAHIIDNLPFYSQLTKLEVFGTNPHDHIWRKDFTSLTSLSWQVQQPFPETDRGSNVANQHNGERDPYALLINVVEATCPRLVLLAISSSRRGGSQYSQLSSSNLERVERYRNIQPSETSKLKHLRHFGYNLVQKASNQTPILDFVTRQRETLTSIDMPAKGNSFNFTLKVYELITNLKTLTLGDTGVYEDDDALEFMERLTKGAFAANIERFSIVRSSLPFSAEFGQLFHSWKKLKFLQIGDKENLDGPYGDDRRFDFESYRTHVLGFITALPPSIEEIYMEINGYDLQAEDDEAFDPICNFGRPIFATLPRLHTCDIHAWISNIGRGHGQIPEKAVFYRRLPLDQSSLLDHPSLCNIPDNRVKEIWTSRMDCVYQEDDVLVTKSNLILDLRKSLETQGSQFQARIEQFEGKDADEVWCGGFCSDAPGSPSEASSPDDKAELPWPLNPAKYPAFRKRF